ncbi:hypothetical protein B0H11DRAFT_2108187 [Mycena galericulata]|nr:hypothetical protein B0H11DRAFT_2108187 [Mycena galericulata]
MPGPRLAISLHEWTSYKSGSNPSPPTHNSTMSIPLTFVDKDIIKTPVVGPDGAVHYTIVTTTGMMHRRKETTVTAASGLVGVLNWRDHTFNINGFQRDIDSLKARTGGIFTSEREWNWGNRPFRLKYHNRQKELLVTPNFEPNPGMARFTPFHGHLFSDNEPAVLYLPYQIQDEFEKMFLLLAILHTEIHRQDQNRAAANGGGAAATG